MALTRTPRERRHTLYFLRWIRGFAPVHLDTEVHMGQVLEHREQLRAVGNDASIVSYILLAAGRTLAEHPAANAVTTGGLIPRVLESRAVNGKLTLDKTVHGRRAVLATVIPGIDRAGLPEIQRQVTRLRDGDPETMPEFAPIRKLGKLPARLGNAAFRAAVGSPSRRAAMIGTVAVTSLGHSVVDGFHSVGGTTCTLGVGRIVSRPIVSVDGAVVVAPVMRLSLTFDHRVIDGAEAADVLRDLKTRLETFAVTAPATGRLSERAAR